ncbi:Membrane-associated zinc metalloprotease [Ligilactobacillus salivarius SMXD51]|uniref:Membrane-associated zinc metalloprotease n=1 Tax=Ligilactobacillus salivarius SMXD51 TaxID=1108963 RepID=H7FXK1_9LACO|nr:Membrane-associated zinc metalloprotease [Ligilactobacillus salivarius SMXD51]
MIITIIAFIIVFGVLVFVHEFGHYFFVKKGRNFSKRIFHWHGA